MKKIFVLFAFCLLAIAYSFSQTWQWAKAGGGTDSDQGFAIAVDKWGNCYATGNYLSYPAIFGMDTLFQNGFNDIFIVKYNSNGNLLWAKHAGGPNGMTFSEAGNAICIDTIGNFYLTGSVAGNATFGNCSISASSGGNIFIAKYDSSGNCIWAKKAGGNGVDEGNGISISDKYLYLTGRFQNTATFDTYSVTAPSGSSGFDAFIARYNPSNGDCLWVRQANGTTAGGTAGRQVIADSNGNSFVAGEYFGAITLGAFNMSSSGNCDVFIAEFDSAGSCLWAKSEGGAGAEYSNGLSADKLNNLYIESSFLSNTTFDTFNLSSAGGYDAVVAKFDGSGNCLWAKALGGTGTDVLTGIATAKSGNCYLLGGSNAPFASGSCSFSGSTSSYILVMDSSGNCNGVKEVAAGFYGLAVDGTENIYVTGAFTGTTVFTPNSMTSAGQNDVFVAKLNGVTGVPPDNEKNSAFNIFPNPSNNNYTMEVTSDFLNSQLYIYNMLGSVLFQTKIIQEHSEISIPALAQGVYQVKLVKPNGASVQRSIVQQ